MFLRSFAAIEAMIMKKYNISAEDFKVMETVILKSEPHKAGQQVCHFQFVCCESNQNQNEYQVDSSV